jgi:hypothetical protein
VVPCHLSGCVRSWHWQTQRPVSDCKPQDPGALGPGPRLRLLPAPGASFKLGPCQWLIAQGCGTPSPGLSFTGSIVHGTSSSPRTRILLPQVPVAIASEQGMPRWHWQKPPRLSVLQEKTADSEAPEKSWPPGARLPEAPRAIQQGTQGTSIFRVPRCALSARLQLEVGARRAPGV